VTTCTVTYTFSPQAARDLINGSPASATITRHRKRAVVGAGTVRNHKLVLTFRHANRGRYRLTLLELEHGQWIVVGHTTLTVS
jgi:hypothetical protein